MALLIESEPQERPYWLLALALLSAGFVWLALVDGRYGLIVQTLAEGLWTTVYVAVVSYALAASIGLLLALASRSRHVWLSQAARFYIEVVRGLPALVILLYVTFVGAPALVNAYQWAFESAIASGWLPDVGVRDVSNTVRGIAALALAYSAFLAEVFRAGLQSVEKNQIEAAQALGLAGSALSRGWLCIAGQWTSGRSCNRALARRAPGDAPNWALNRREKWLGSQNPQRQPISATDRPEKRGLPSMVRACSSRAA